MSDQLTIAVQSRAGIGSHAARKLRRQGLAPAILYGHGAPQPVTVRAAEFAHAVHTDHYGSQMVKLVLDGQDAGAALVKSVHVNTLTHEILSVDFLRVSMEEHIQVTVSVVLAGEPIEARRGGVLEQLEHAVGLRCRASDVPSEITYDVTALAIGDAVRAGQLALPPNCELMEDPEQVIATLAPPTVPAFEQPTAIAEGAGGPALTGGKQQDDSQLAT